MKPTPAEIAHAREVYEQSQRASDPVLFLAYVIRWHRDAERTRATLDEVR